LTIGWGERTILPALFIWRVKKMNLKDAFGAAKRIIPKDKYFSIKVEVTHTVSGTETMEIAGYVADLGWTADCETFEEVLEAIKNLPRKNEIPDVDDERLVS
jgi:hypothetical protein